MGQGDRVRVIWPACAGRGVQDGLLQWQFATARETKAGRVVELRPDLSVDDMMRLVQKGASVKEN
jgi:hypothetical protein